MIRPATAYALSVMTERLSVRAVAEGPVHAATPAPGFLRRFWVPVLLLAAFAGLTALGINGSSAAAIRPALGSSVSSDPHLLVGVPLDIRADEWAINTPLSIMQVRTGMPRIQPLMGDGADMALSYDVPVADRWAIFHPQHWGFIVLPLDQGFAFHWWLPALLLVFALWLLTVTLLPRRNALGLLLGAGAAFSPFLQWWYLAGSFLPEALAVLSCALFIRILQTRSWRRRSAYAAAFGWTLASFILVLYPPFQIPCALVAGSFCLGYLLYAGRELGWRSMLKRLAVVGGATAVAGAFVLLFLLDHRSAVQAIASSVYPGTRTVPTGGYSISRLFSGFLDRQLTDTAAAKSIDVNQSEASSPLLAGLLAVPVIVWLLVAGIRRHERPNPVLLLLLAVLALFLAQLFLPHMDIVSGITLLNRVPANRLLLGMGMLSNLLLVGLAWQLSTAGSRPRFMQLGAFLGPFLLLSALALYLHTDHAVFVGSLVLAVALAATIALAVALWTIRRPALGAAVLLLVSLFVAGAVNPISAGVSTTDDLPVARAVGQIDKADPGGWIMQMNRLPAGMLTEEQVHSYSVVYNYPQLGLWHELDPTGANADSYNRYGFAFFEMQQGPTRFLDHYLDQFTIAIDGCAPFVQHNVKHILADRALDTGCVRQRRTVLNGKNRYYIYDVVTGPADDRPIR
jgi:hypothetical protein